MPAAPYIPFLIAGMLITGCSNSLWSKWQDMQCVENCSPQDDPSSRVYFEQPVWQTLQMFVGELGCFLPVIWAWWRQRNAPAPLVHQDDPADKGTALRGWKIFLFFAPAACDLTGTTLMNVGLLFTPVSIYQMTRGALVLWVGVFSVIFLRRKLFLYQWLSLVTVMLGVSLVGLSGSLAKSSGTGIIDGADNDLVARVADLHARVMADDSSRVLAGILFVLFAQLFTAAQFVIEEKVMAKYSVPPLVAVGYEGLFGLVSVLIAMPFLYSLRGYSSFFDLGRGFRQMIYTPSVLASSCAIAVSIGLFNFFGLSVTRHVSATARSTIDTCRTIGIWLVSLGLGWEKLTWPFSILQIAGFGLLVYGTFVFNNLVLPPSFIQETAHVSTDSGVDENTALLSGDEEERALLSERNLSETAVLPADLGTSGYDVVPPPARRG